MMRTSLLRLPVSAPVAMPVLALLLCVSCGSLPRESRETVDAILVHKAPIEMNDRRLDMRQPHSTWLFPCVYRLVGEAAGGATNRHIGVFHEGIERWRISQRYAERSVGERYRLTIGRTQDYPKFQAMPREDPDTERAVGCDWYFDLNEASFSFQKLRADYRMWQDLRGTKRSP